MYDAASSWILKADQLTKLSLNSDRDLTGIIFSTVAVFIFIFLGFRFNVSRLQMVFDNLDYFVIG